MWKRRHTFIFSLSPSLILSTISSTISLPTRSSRAPSLPLCAHFGAPSPSSSRLTLRTPHRRLHDPTAGARALKPMEEDILPEAEAGARHCPAPPGAIYPSPSPPPPRRRHGSGRASSHSPPIAALPPLCACPASNLLHVVWECPHGAVIPSKGPKSSPGIPKIPPLPQG